SDYFYSTNSPGSQGSAPLNQIVFDSPTYTGANTKWLGWDHEVSPVPEPSTYGALFMGAMLVAGWWFRRRQSA
ncbi:MAG: PEP-CTERM sorting domain-containing protein, partial [Opitutales bacterium]